MKLGKRTAQLLREAIVLAHVEGARWGRCGSIDEYPRDYEVVSHVLACSVHHRDLYPTLAKLDEAHEADAEYRMRSLERIKALMRLTDPPTSS